MPRSHPPTLTTLARRTLVDDCHLAAGEKILVATSGGGDSTALLSVLCRLAPELGVTLAAHGVDHGLRKGAGAELDLAAELSSRLGVPFTRTQLTIPPGGNLQARARSARREALEAARLSTGASRIATAHHANDRAETVLLRLLHGARPEGLAVLGPIDGVWIRPLIRAQKEDIGKHLLRHDLAHADDPSNRDPRFERTRVRLEVLPLLEDLSPAIVTHLTALADDLTWALGSESGARREGAPPLRRAQIEALRRALDLGKPTRIRLPGRTGSPDLDLVVEPARTPRKAGPVTRGGANGAKSG